MSSRPWVIAAALLVAPAAQGCAAPRTCQPSVSPPPVPVAVAPALPPPPADLPTESVPARESLCWAKGRPAPRPARNPSPYCRPFDAQVLARVEARIRKEIVVADKPAKLVIDYGCDAASASVRDVFYEHGSGHGGSLGVVRFHYESDRIVVRAVMSTHYDTKTITVRTGDLDVHALDAIVATARVAVLARPHVVRFQSARGGLGMHGYSSSNDFHRRLSIVDDGGDTTDGAFSGYDSSASQPQIVPLTIATEEIAKVLDGHRLVTVPASDHDRQLLTDRFLVTMAGSPFWWVEERYVALMAALGTVDAVPALAAIVAHPPANGSGDRVREAAIDAIAAITGWNPRAGAGGAVRTTAEAARAVAVECEL